MHTRHCWIRDVCCLLLNLSFVFISAACLFRYNALSFIYLIYLLLIPLFAEPTSTTMQGKIWLVHSLNFTHSIPLVLSIAWRILTASTLNRNIVVSNVNQPFSRGLEFPWDEDGFGTDFSPWKAISVSAGMNPSVIIKLIQGQQDLRRIKSDIHLMKIKKKTGRGLVYLESREISLRARRRKLRMRAVSDHH